MRYVLSALLLFECLAAVLYVGRLVSALPGHDASVVALVVMRGAVGALQFAGGWLLADRRPAGLVIARWAILASTVWIILAVGFNLAPTGIYPWWRTQATAAYGFYACAVLVGLRHLSRQPAP